MFALIFFTEFKKVAKADSSADILGILCVSIVGLVTFNGIFLAPLGLYSNIDPVYHVIKMFNPNGSFASISLMFRIVFTFWATIESARTQSILLPQILCVFNLFMTCLKRIKNITNGNRSLMLYIHLQLICHLGQNCTRYLAGVLMACGLVLLVAGNYTVFVGWKSFPVALYTVMVTILVVVYVVVSQTVPMVTQCHSFSKQMIRVDWFLKPALKTMDNLFATRKARTLWRLRIQAQKPISFYYGPALYENNTKINFYSRVISHTIDTLLLL